MNKHMGRFSPHALGITMIIVSIAMLIAPPVFAQGVAGGGGVGGGVTLTDPLNGCNFQCLATKIIGFMLDVGLILVPAMALVAGFQFLTAAGNETKISSAKNTLLYTIIGTAVLLISQGVS